MAKRTANKTNAAPPAAPAAPAPTGAKDLWPAEFLAPGPSAIIVAGGILTSAIIGYLMYVNGLVGFKQFIAYVIGLGNPYDVGVAPGSRDAGAVLLGFIWTLIGCAIHPALGLSILMLLRPWLDGYTFQTDNVYFIWGTMLCFITWGVRTVLSGAEVRAWKPALLFATFPAIACLLLSQSINYNESFRGLIIWPTYVIIFFLVANLASNPRIFRVLVGAVAISVAAEAVFAIMQYRYILPFLRLLIQNDPRLLEEQFDTGDPTVELARRFNINRAFGTVLFPNALAAFLITWIPLFAAAAWNNLQSWRQQSAAPAPRPADPMAHRYRAVTLAALVWFAGAIFIYVLMQFPVTYATTNTLPWYLGTGTSMGLSIGLALLPAAGLFLLALSRDVSFALCVARTSLYALAIIISLIALALTFSRGGFLGLLGGAVFGAALLLLPPGRVLPRVPAFLKRAAILTAACFAVTFFAAQAPAPESAAPEAAAPESAAPAPVANTTFISTSAQFPSTDITTQGQDVGVKDLASGASFRARFTYWKVALRMFADNPWAGVGLKCFGWAYPKYQYLGAYDVREAHNAYLQAFCETGVLGGVALLLFWGFVVVVCAVRALEETDRPTKFLYTGIGAGLAAFLLHAGIDINFSHPTLMMFASLLAGLVFALAPAPAQPGKLGHLIVLPALLVAALCAGIGLRVCKQDLALSRVSLINVADDKEMNMRLAVARHFLITIPEKAGNKQQPPSIYFASARTFIEDTSILTGLGPLFTAKPGGGYQPVQMGSVIPPDAILMVNKPWVARKFALDAAFRCISELEAIDSRFPHNPKVAAYISQWYQALVESANTPRLKEQHTRAVERMVAWGQEAVRRNPWHADLHVTLAFAYWETARYSTVDNRKQFELAMDEVEQSVALSPVTPPYWGALAGSADTLAEAYERAGLKDKAAEYRKRAAEARGMVKHLSTERGRLGLDTNTARPKPQGAQ